MSFLCGVAVGWISLATAAALVVGAVIRLADYTDHKVPPKQPEGVRDPETGAVWTESRRVDTWA